MLSLKNLIIIILTLLAFNLFANEVSPPLRGEGVYSWYFIKIYKGKLWSFKDSELYSKPLKLELQYLKNFTGQEIIKQSLKELASAGATQEELESFRSKLQQIMPDVKANDTITASFDPVSGLTFFYNSTKEVGKLSDVSEAKKFLNIWLGEKTTAPDFRNILLGNK